MASNTLAADEINGKIVHLDWVSGVIYNVQNGPSAACIGLSMLNIDSLGIVIIIYE